MTLTVILIGVFTLIGISLSFFSFISTFYVSEKRKIKDPLFFRKDVIEEKHTEKVKKYLKNYIKMPYRYVETKSFDNLVLRGNYYELQKNAPLIIFFHGYKSNMYCDSCLALDLAKHLKYNFLIVNERAHGFSDGKVITFGEKERFDVLSWVNFALLTFGKDTKIVLYGISMGGASVMMSTSLYLPNNVKVICSDSGYSSPKDVIEERIKNDMHLPKSLFYPFVYFGALIFGHFKLNNMTAEKALKDNDIPIIMLQGEKDRIVSVKMAQKNYKMNRGEKKLVLFKTAKHGVSYLEEPEKYKSEIVDFIKRQMAKAV